MFTREEILQKLKSLANPKNVEGMARFGINLKKPRELTSNTIQGRLT